MRKKIKCGFVPEQLLRVIVPASQMDIKLFYFINNVETI